MKACLKTPRASKCAHVMGFCHGTVESLSPKKNTHKKKKTKSNKKGIYGAIDNVLLAAGRVDLSQQ